MIFKSNDEKFKGLSLIGAVFYTVIFSGPIILFILYIISMFTDGENQGFAVIAPVAAVSIFLTAAVWRCYIYKRKNKDNIQVHNGLVNAVLFFAVIVEVVVCTIELMAVISFLSQGIFCSSDFIFYQLKRPQQYIHFFFEMELMAVLYILMYKLSSGHLYEGGHFIIKNAKKYTAAIISVNVVLLYLSVSSVIVTYKDKIMDYSWNNIKGTEYSYKDIVSVDTGFKVKGSKNNEPEFYYEIVFKDGREMKFSDTNASGKYDDTYMDIAAFDKIVMQNQNVKKTGSTENAKKCSLDKKYIDRLCTVVKNGI